MPVDKNRVPRTIPEEGGPIPMHRDTTVSRVRIGLLSKDQQVTHTHTHRQRTTPRHRHTHTTRTTPQTPKRTPPTNTSQRSKVARRRCVPPPTPGWVAAPKSACELAFTRYSFTYSLLCTNPSSFYCPSHLYRPHGCNTIAILVCNIQPPSDPPCSCHTPYNSVHCNIL